MALILLSTAKTTALSGILHTIFFHRTFHAIRPINRDLLDITLPAVDDPDLETLIDQRATALVRQIDSSAQQVPFSTSATSAYSNIGNGTGGKGQVAVQFFEKRRKKSYFTFTKADEEVCWEQWTLDVTMARPKSDSDLGRVQEAVEVSLQKAALKVVSIASEEKDHIPPITTSETNPFPYQIVVNPKDPGWGKGIGLF